MKSSICLRFYYLDTVCILSIFYMIVPVRPLETLWIPVISPDPLCRSEISWTPVISHDPLRRSEISWIPVISPYSSVTLFPSF